ncbi:HvfC/BufC N-terminal domain-containing protein [Cognaticolwellia mytili]|uniref:HvfC/BufC N-terminal domain-containing protein n=1 Tax=Cognaticolwellia mytili TaxID=1888913 RepID=UPI00117DB394|nr:DNA-binding domain-containing protein [Cognaticolwellia mytili]
MSELSLHTLQQQMINYLIDDELTITHQVEEHGGISRDARLHIYKNAYQMRLKETIDNDHEQLGIYLGDDLFDQMVDGYIKAYPSNNTSLRNFADALPEFLANHAPFNGYPLISELAHFERLLMVAFDAADTERFTRELLIEIPHEQWPTLVFRFHPSLQICHFNFNTVETWQALKQEKAPQPATKIANTWLLWRNKQRLTQFRSISQVEFSLLEMILKGSDFSSLCDYLLTQNLEEDVSQVALNYLLAWIDDGILANR